MTEFSFDDIVLKQSLIDDLAESINVCPRYTETELNKRRNLQSSCTASGVSCGGGLFLSGLECFTNLFGCLFGLGMEAANCGVDLADC